MDDHVLARALHEELNAPPRRRARAVDRGAARSSAPAPATRTYRPQWPKARVRVASGGVIIDGNDETDDDGARTKRTGRVRGSDALKSSIESSKKTRVARRRGDDELDDETLKRTPSRATTPTRTTKVANRTSEEKRLRKNELSRLWKAKRRAMERVAPEEGTEKASSSKERSKKERFEDEEAKRAHVEGETEKKRRLKDKTKREGAAKKLRSAKPRMIAVDTEKTSDADVTVAVSSADGSVVPTTPPLTEVNKKNKENAPTSSGKAESQKKKTDDANGADEESGEKQQKRKNERRLDPRFLKCKEAELSEFPPGMIVWVKLSSTHKGQWWPGRVWKLRQCARAYDLLEIKPTGECGLVKLFGAHTFEWAVKEDLAPYDAQNQTLYRESMMHWFSVNKSRAGGRGTARKALHIADAEEIAEWSDPWSTSDDSSSESEEETEAVATAKANDKANEVLRVGLTPDWIVHATCKVFEMDLPTIEAPLIKGLLDPCTNSHLRPNIPAEKCYDKKDDGLKMENSWEGYHVLVNPPYEAQVQWRFINRAINEVEWERCPGVILVCRNSTDTSYFQRLLPFPRIHLRRTAVQFKDYSHCPVGFGICVFCIVSPTNPKQAEMYHRFYDEFHQSGEFNIPVDNTFVKSSPFIELTTRLHLTACATYRDSWIACDVCDRWREIPFNQMLKARKSKVWQCRDSFPLGCQTPLTKQEIAAFSVAKQEQNTVLVASKAEGRNGPVGVFAAESMLEGETSREGGNVHGENVHDRPSEVLDAGDDGDDEREEENEDDTQERTRDFVANGGKLHELGCPCNWEPCRIRRAKEDKILSKTFPGLRLEWEKIRDELTDALTPFERERLEKIEANKRQLRALTHATEEQTSLTSHKVSHASAAESAALRMFDIAKRKQKTKMVNAERRERKVASLKKQMEAAEKRLSDIMSDIREASHGVDTALKVLQAIRSRAHRVQSEFNANKSELKKTREECRRKQTLETREQDDIWLAARDRCGAEVQHPSVALPIAITDRPR